MLDAAGESYGGATTRTDLPMNAKQVLLVEDDERIGSSLVRALTGNDFDVRWERTGHEAAATAISWEPDLILLDLGLPDMDGLDVCRRIHAANPLLEVIMLTARDEELDIVVGLDAGAVDYITKPFKLAELLARVRAQLRRQGSRDPGVLDAGSLRLEVPSRRVWLHGEELSMRAKEFDLLARLMLSLGEVVTREALMSEVWDENWFGSTKTLDFHIAALRRKLDGSDDESRITTVRGVGYRLERG
ncbi:response regulator transcription factor [Nocardioides sp.]|jgi:DNA-binding response OmpR family regulator|uniref:response regulator transcription factor n=1 Tax=Nocardioides sp. TaxID=35761 RepID=UPI0023832092|nr:response regulator transcription factor [Nocardioides sp.]MDE0774979.1 response regulator transcription factor [Nocardioides sp.]